MQVSDTGIGIPADQITSIFDPFTQATASKSPTEPRSAYSREHGGTGLGLTISRRLARLMSGDVTVESTVGRGTTFTLWLPAPLDGDETPGTTMTDRRTGSRDAPGLAVVGRALRDRATVILEGHVGQLRGDFAAPNAAKTSAIDLEDHLDTLLAELALSLSSVDQADGLSSIGLRDGSAIQKVLAQRHGAQRASLGWREDDVIRELRLLQSEIETELRIVLDGDPKVDLRAAFGVLAYRFQYAERFSIEGWRKRMLPDIPAESAAT